MLEPEANDTVEFFDDFIRLANEADATELLALMITKCPVQDLRVELLWKPTTLIDTGA